MPPFADWFPQALVGTVFTLWGCLRLYGPGLGRGGANALARSATLTGLTELSFRSGGAGAAGFATLAASPNVARLERLSLDATTRGDDAEIQRLIEVHRAALARDADQPAHDVGRPDGHECAGRAAGERQDRGFDEQLLNQPRAGRSANLISLTIFVAGVRPSRRTESTTRRYSYPLVTSSR